MTDVDAWRAAGLYDPDAPNAADRRALLEFLTAQGIPLERLVEAHRRGGLVSVAFDAVRSARGAPLPVEELAARAGTTVENVRRAWRALGLPAEGSGLPLTERDVEAFQAFTLGSALFGEEAVLQFSRVLGSSLARIAEAAGVLFLTEVEGPLTESGGGEAALARANLDALAALESVPRVLESMFVHHMEVALRRTRRARAGHEGYETVPLAVGFVDLVGFTQLSRQMEPRELARFVTGFEAQAADLVSAFDGRVVKLIGDEVMFVVVDPAAGCEVALGLMEAFHAADARITPRGGLGYGDLLTRHGDYYGPVVNLASRAADVAVPDEVLVTAELHRRVDGDARFRFEPAGRRMLKGFDEPVPLASLSRARR